MTTTLTLDMVIDACSRGGASALTMTTRLLPAGGTHMPVAPARYAGRGGAEYIFEDRFIPDDANAARPVRTVLLDSAGSQGNRCEASIIDAIREAHPVFSRMPRIEVAYDVDGDTQTFSDLELPGRAFDGHIRAGSIDGISAAKHESYIRLRNANAGNARALLESSPISLTGSWDASRKARQARFPRPLVSEIIGVVSGRGNEFVVEPGRRSGARVDPVAASVRMEKNAAARLVDEQRHELTDATASKAGKVEKRDNRVPMSPFGLGAIPPGTESLAGVSVRDIVRTSVLSLSTLRQMRYGGTPNEDTAIRALLAALLLDAQVRADSELYLRAGCHLVEAGATVVHLDQRQGNFLQIEPLNVDSADALLEAAYDRAVRDAALDWHGQILSVVGNPEIIRSASDDVPED